MRTYISLRPARTQEVVRKSKTVSNLNNVLVIVWTFQSM
jgi:hypothetical protein